MTTRWRPEFNPNHLYFITTKAVKYQHLFKRDLIKRILLDAFYLANVLSQATLYAFVIMPNHIHVLIQFSELHPMNYWVRTMKTTAARLLVRHYQVEDNENALSWLASQVENPKKQVHKVWEDNYLAKSVITAQFMLQKLEYIHNNPVQPHWQLAASPSTYPWSSAAFYEERPCLIPVSNAFELLG